MSKYILILILIVSIFPSFGCKQNPQQKVSTHQEAKETAENIGKVEAEIKINNDYILRLYNSGLGNDMEAGYDAFEILHRGQKVYTENEERYTALYIENGKEIYLNKTKGVNLSDITGDGIPDLIISVWSGGAHCCYSTTIFSLGEQFKKIVRLEGKHTSFDIKDIDNDNVYELVGHDWTFEYWQSSFAGSPAPEIVLKYKNGNYVIATDLMKKPPPKSQEFYTKFNDIRKKMGKSGEVIHQESEVWGSDGGIPPELWGYMLDLMYSGNGQLALEFFDKVWSDKRRGKKEFLEVFKKQISKSPYWSEIKKMNGW
ncbi:MAG: hypothetical protein M1147_03285 [Nitrospirae bacterium]|nr:hypothetical protein [Nitrospirota bacterium]MCL5977139.1 hypothetical protein [Nitrospirota bacterium]